MIPTIPWALGPHVSNAPMLTEKKREISDGNLNRAFRLTVINFSGFRDGTFVWMCSAVEGLMGVNVMNSLEMKCNQQVRDLRVKDQRRALLCFYSLFYLKEILHLLSLRSFICNCLVLFNILI